jgi:hypothetical protein
MNAGIAVLIIVLSAIVAVTWLINNWIRARHGIPTDEELAVMAVRGGRDADRNMELLASENAGLKGQVLRLEERIAVLERIATDPAERTAREIEQLR